MARNRTSPFDKAIATRIAAVLQRGLTAVDAFTAAGISESTYYQWIKDGEKALKRIGKKGAEPTERDKALAEFAESVTRARAEGKVLLVESLTKIATSAGHDQAKALMFLLERMHPHEFGRKYIRIENGGIDGQPIKTEGVLKLIIDDPAASTAGNDLPIHEVAPDDV